MPGAAMVDLGDWEAPDREPWVARLDDAVRASTHPRILVAHSLGALLVCHWAARHGDADGRVVGAMLVAPPDPSGAAFPSSIRGFAEPTSSLPFRALVVASRNDPYATFDWSARLASRVGARLVDVGPCGHLNAAAGFGPWPRGEALLTELRDERGSSR